MTDINIKVRKHYNAVGLTERIKALATVTPESVALMCLLGIASKIAR